MKRALPPHVMEEMLRSVGHPEGPLGRMCDIERGMGNVIMTIGQTRPFPIPVEKWELGTLISITPTNEARIVLVTARRPRRGAFRSLVEGIQAAGFVPVVIAPMGKDMPVILKRWGWVKTLARVPEADPRFAPSDEWRPAR